MSESQLPILFCCGGCCHTGQLTQDVGVYLQQQGLVELMAVSAIAAQSTMHLQRALAAPYIIVLDGCSIGCGKACLQNAGLTISRQIDIAELAKQVTATGQHSVLQECALVAHAVQGQLLELLPKFGHQYANGTEASNVIALFPCTKVT